MALLASLAWGGCGDDSSHAPREQAGDEGEDGTGTPWWYSDSDDIEAGGSDEGRDGDIGDKEGLMPFSHAVEGIVQNRAKWGVLEVVTKAMRIEQGMDELWTGTYAELDIEVTNTTRFDDELSKHNTWDLLLADGTRIKQGNTIELSLAPESTVPYTLRYPVDAKVDLKGAALELNGQTRGELAPEKVPLDQAYEADVDVELKDAVGKVFASTRPEDFTRVSFKIVSASVSRNSATNRRAEYGKMFVDLVVDLTLLADSSGTNIQNNDFAILVDGKVAEPVNDINDILDEGHPLRTPVVFEIDDTVKDFIVRFDVGWDPDSTPETETASLPVHL